VGRGGWGLVIGPKANNKDLWAGTALNGWRKKTGTETLGQLAAISDQLSRIQGFTPPKVPKFVS